MPSDCMGCLKGKVLCIVSISYCISIDGFNSVPFTSQELSLNQTFRQSAAVFFSGWEYSVCMGVGVIKYMV